MALDNAALTSSLVADLAREFPWATRDQIDRVVKATAAKFADATIATFVPILARREARRTMRLLSPKQVAGETDPYAPERTPSGTAPTL